MEMLIYTHVIILKLTISTEYLLFYLCSRSLRHGETQTAKFSFIPRKAGKRTLLVDVDTTQVKDFKAAADVEVLPQKN